MRELQSGVVRNGARCCPSAARSRGGRRGAVPEFRVAVAHKGAAADRTPMADRTREVSHSLMAARKRRVAARPCVALGRSWEAARKHTVVAPPRVVADRTWEAGSRAAAHERTAVAHSRVVALRTRVRVATCRRTVVAYSRVVADRPEASHKRVVADRRTAAADNRAVADRTRGVSRIRAAAHKMVDRTRQCTAAIHNRTVAGSHPGL
jgi:hypothetical protein